LDVIKQLPHELEKALRDNPVASTLLDNWEKLNLPNCWLVAGAVVQSYWNSAHGYSPIHGVSDADIAYFDSNDLTEESEADHERRISNIFDTLPVRFDVKNEARVHLWYEECFGYPIDAYTSVKAAIDTFPTTAGSIGIRPLGEDIECYATFGFEDLLNLIVRPNKRQVTRSIYAKKVVRWQTIWPRLKIIAWEDA
jgi:hypothetical protein